MERPSEVETKLVQAIANPRRRQQEIARMLEALRPNDRFVMRKRWKELALDERLDTWRRLQAYRMLIERATSYPQDLEPFFQDVVAPLGIKRDRMVDMTMGQFVPLERKKGRMIGMVPLPFPTSVGSAALYLAVNRGRGVVEEAVIYPGGEVLE